MATIDDINILDRQPVDLEMLLKSGKKPIVEPIEGSTLPFDIKPVSPSFNPAKDFFYNNILNPQGRNLFNITSMVGKEATNPLNFNPATATISKADKIRRGIASLPPTLTRNPSKAEIKQNFIDQHPPVGSIDSKTGKPVTEQLIKNRANAYEKTLKTKA